MGKKDKDTAAPAEKEAKTKEAKVKAPKTKEAKVKAPKTKEPKPKAPVDPVKVQNLIRLLGVVALILAVIAFLLQLFAVISHHWKWQTIDLRSVISPQNDNAAPSVHDDSRLDQNFGLFSREVKVYGNKDEQLDVWGSTRFPRVDDGDDNFHHCLSQPTTLRGVFLTCSEKVTSSEQCHCRRYPYWNAVIIFEILALIFLGLLVCVVALISTKVQEVLKLAGAGLALLAFIFLLVGLILILSYLKRETRSFADAYPHIHKLLSKALAFRQHDRNSDDSHSSILRRAIVRRSHEVYRVYPLLSGQHPFNETHFVELSKESGDWVYKPYINFVQEIPVEDISPKSPVANTMGSTIATTLTSTHALISAGRLYGPYGPLVGYDQVYETSKACIGYSTVLSIIAMVLALLLALILVFSWLSGKKLAPSTKTATKPGTDTKYEPVPTEIPMETVSPKPTLTTSDPKQPVGETVIVQKPAPTVSDPKQPVVETVVVQKPAPTVSDPKKPVEEITVVQKPIPTTLDPKQPIGDAIVLAKHAPEVLIQSPGTQATPTVVRDVIIPGDTPVQIIIQDPATTVTINQPEATQNV